MMRRPFAPVVFACVAVLLLVHGSTANAQPRVRLAQGAAAGTTGQSRSSGTVVQPTPAPDLQTVQGQPSTGGLMTLPALTAPSLNFDPYNCATPVVPTQPAPAPACYSEGPAYRFRIFGEYLWLQPGEAATTSFALPINGAIVPPPDPPIPVGPLAMTDPDFAGAYRLGFGFQTGPQSDWAVSVFYLDNTTSSNVSVSPGGIPVLHSLVVHPSTVAADAEFLDASATSQLVMQVADLEYRSYIWGNTCSPQTLNYLVGGRYALIEQDFSAVFSNTTTIETVTTAIDFQGGGIRVGLEGEREGPRFGFTVYGKGYASLLAGQFSSTYSQQDNFSGIVANTSWKDGRVVPVLDLEVGIGWKSAREKLLLSAGYQFSAWYNVVSNEEFIGAVQSSQFGDVSDTLILNGPVGRAEYRF